jgi:uncharacterized protein
MKKPIVFILAIFLIVPNLLCAVDRVIDNAGLLSAEQVQTLEHRIEEIAAQYNFDLVIVTEKNIGGAAPETRASVEAFADDFFDNNGYGRGDDRNGALLLQVTETRDWHISTRGKGPLGGEAVFTDYALTQSGNHVLAFLQKDDPYGAYNSFIDDAAKYLAVAAEGGHYTFFREWLWLFITIAWVVSLLIGFIVVSAWKSGMNTALAGEQAAVYIVPGSLQFTAKDDKLLYSTVSKTAKAQASSSGGGSGGSRSHIRSSGSSHGGRGGKY